MGLTPRIAAKIDELEGERERIKQRRDDELAEIERQLIPLRKVQRKVEGDPELELLIADLIKVGLNPLKD